MCRVLNNLLLQIKRICFNFCQCLIVLPVVVNASSLVLVVLCIISVSRKFLVFSLCALFFSVWTFLDLSVFLLLSYFSH